MRRHLAYSIQQPEVIDQRKAQLQAALLRNVQHGIDVRE